MASTPSGRWCCRRTARAAQVKAPVSWREAALVSAACWTVSGLGHGVLGALDEPQLSPAPLIDMGLAQWFIACHRCWRAAVAACVAGFVVLFGLVDILRTGLGRYVAGCPGHGGRVDGRLDCLPPGRSRKWTPPWRSGPTLVTGLHPPA